ncbi:hypothetical protein [Clostridium estertheticum]|uniref:hypothetical protein n=1 Tax=Clostridium estertheticum TaxID=238834 RepID=UPI001C6E49DD|nr:hypothetical protein [Clostridium estertheticum]MBW9154299.1 hypothetical protein [Clostridium estertheticum]WLC86672.1 hypothetical protein KTC97_22145 [Clostridium estertheticum]
MKARTVDMIYKCLDCGKEILVKGSNKTQDGRTCDNCNGHVVPYRYGGEDNGGKNKGLTVDIDVEFKGYDKVKQQLRNLEATLDRILEKQEKVSKTKVADSITVNDGGTLKIGDSYGIRIEDIPENNTIILSAKEFSINGKSIDNIYDEVMKALQPKRTDIDEMHKDLTYVAKLYNIPVDILIAIKDGSYDRWMATNGMDTKYLVNAIMYNVAETIVRIDGKPYACGGGTMRALNE